MRRHLAHRPHEVQRLCRSLELVAAGALRHGPVHLLIASASPFMFYWDSAEAG